MAERVLLMELELTGGVESAPPSGAGADRDAPGPDVDSPLSRHQARSLEFADYSDQVGALIYPYLGPLSILI